MRWVIAVVAGFVVLIALAVFVVPAAGAPEPGAITVRPSERTCAAIVAEDARAPEEVSVWWIWASDGYGRACHYRYADGSTSSTHVTDRAKR